MAPTAPTADLVTSRDAWDADVLAQGGHPLQLWGWGQVKAAGAWTPYRLRVSDGGSLVGLAQVLVRRLPAPFGRLSYVPRGPVVVGDAGPEGPELDERRAAVTAAVVAWCREHVGGLGVSLEPDWPAGSAAVPGARQGTATVLVSSTVVLDLTRTPDDLLADMDRSPRHDIRKAARDGMDIRRVETDDDVRAVLGVYRETARRADFALHSDEYYLSVHHELGPRSVLVAAYDEAGAPVCFSWCINSTRTSFQLYRGGNAAGRKMRATTPVYWRSVEIAQQDGLARFDFNGLLNDGISDFKRSLAKHEDAMVGTLDVPFSPMYDVWNRALPLAKRTLRALRGLRRDKAEAS
ncbi:MAG: peptidoglycan bridge formation glycyltransferase FemA/FemB family protein [Cellulomonas sp.]|nr:peptidoglycan bridge formation glycyltransferase FemA/FemB family protein [Cellulomonas sp.]